MAIQFPTSLDNLTNPTAANTLASPAHHTQHSDANDAIEALEAKVGIDGSATTTSHDYKLSGVIGSDKAVSKTGSETLTNKTLTSPIINLGSDAAGDMFYRNSGGAIARLPIGSAGQVLDVSVGGLPEWINNPSASNGSTTVKGVFEEATAAEINAGTATGGTGAVLAVSPDQLILSNFRNRSKYLYATRAGDTASGVQNIAHGLGVIPRTVRIQCTKVVSGTATMATCDVSYNGTDGGIGMGMIILASTAYVLQTGTVAGAGTDIIIWDDIGGTNAQTGIITFDATNIIITWTKIGSPTAGTITESISIVY